MKRVALFTCIGLIFYWAVSLGQEIYQWVDEKGTVHFTDDMTLVPERYQDQVQKKKPLKEPAASPSAKTSEDPRQSSEPKDLLGRGEEWWREKALEWREKLNIAKTNYEAAQAALKAKQNELDQSIYKPDSLKRKLKAEIKVLEEKATEQKKQVDEANNMLEKVLPRQAEEYRANPMWVK